MHIARLQLTGFKSFATKTTLEFDRGLTAVVGPNGSGKSNVADAVRWVLGEQNKTKLRLEDRESVIYAGSSQRARASFAEVIITFDNSDGAFPLELAEIEIARRLYRSGESDYRLAGHPAKLSDISLALAEAGVSPGGYSIIGQGMVDQLILASPADRRLLFDEAAGIRGPELSRQAAKRKLEATQSNLVRLRDILAELEPRLGSLERVVQTADHQAKLSDQIDSLRRQVVAARLHTAQDQAEAAAGEAAQSAAALARLEADQLQLSARLEDLRARRQAGQAERAKLNTELTGLEAERAAVLAEYTETQSQLAGVAGATQTADGLAGQVAQLQKQLAATQAREAELAADLRAAATSLERAGRAVERAGREVAAAQQALVALRDEQTDGSRDQYLRHALEILKVLAAGLGENRMNDQSVKLLVHKAGRLLSHAARHESGGVVAQLQEAQQQLEAAMGRRETAVEHQTNVTITQRSLEIDHTHQTEQVRRLEVELSRLAAGQAQAQQAAAAHLRLTKVIGSQRAALGSLDAKLAEARGRYQAAADPTSAAVQTETEAALALERCRTQLAAAATQARAAATAQAAAAEAMASALKLAASWGIPAAEAQNLPAPAAELTVLAVQLTEAEATLAARSAAQTDQLAEYEEVRSRHADLQQQIADLEQAQADIETVIHQLESLVRERFKANMAALAEQFSANFGRLVPGGTASLVLEPVADGSFGVNLKASPAGKRLTNLTALSGGERTLTGVALLAAILRVNPSPFIVLDEIDAALDEANSGRLANILTELSEQSQLIVVTHNRQTMEAARMLFGITQSPRQASHIVPLRLDEAAAMAAR